MMLIRANNFKRICKEFASRGGAYLVDEYIEELIERYEFFIAHGADVNTLKNKQGRTVFSLIKKLGNERLIALCEKIILDKQVADSEEVVAMSL